MFLRHSKKIGACYERAAVCRRNAERAGEARTEAAFLRIEQSWLDLARAFERAEAADGIRTPVEHMIGPLTFRCPQTGRELNAGIETSYEALAGSWSRLVNVHCEECKTPHPVPVRDGYIRSGSPQLG